MLIIKGATLEKQEQMPFIILDPDPVFDVTFSEDDSVMDSDFVRKIITDIDKIDVTDTTWHTRQILAYKNVPTEWLATGTKNLVVCKYYESPSGAVTYHRLGRMGENCFKWLMQISKEKDVYVVTTVYRRFKDSDFDGGCIFFEDLGVTAHNHDEVLDAMIDLQSLHLLEG